MKRIPLLLLPSFLHGFLFAQTYTWQKEYNDSSAYFINERHLPSNGGYLHLVRLAETQNWTFRNRLLFTDSLGQIAWMTEFPSFNVSEYSMILDVPAGGYFFTRHESYNPNAPYDYYEAFRFSGAGALLWAKKIYPAAAPYRLFMQATYSVAAADNGFVVSGDVIDTAAMDYAYHLYKLDTTGNVAWSKIYHTGTYKNRSHSLDQYPNGDLLLTGDWLASTTFGRLYPVVIRTDANGNELWAKRYSSNTTKFMIWEGRVTSDNGCIITGQKLPLASGKTEIFLLKLDSAGNFQWGKSYGDSLRDYCGKRVRELPGGGYAVGAWVESDTTSAVLVTDAAGQVQWVKEYHAITYSNDLFLVPGGFSLAGIGYSDRRVMHIRTDLNGDAGCNVTALTFYESPFTLNPTLFGPPQTLALATMPSEYEPYVPAMNVTTSCFGVGMAERPVPAAVDVFPVPASATLHVSCGSHVERAELYNITGQLVLCAAPAAASFALDVSGLAPGVYLLRLETENETVIQKVVVGE